jgi:hypothetical protein
MRTRFVSTVFHEMGLGLWCLTPLSTIFQSAGVQMTYLVLLLSLINGNEIKNVEFRFVIQQSYIKVPP